MKDGSQIGSPKGDNRRERRLVVEMIFFGNPEKQPIPFYQSIFRFPK